VVQFSVFDSPFTSSAVNNFCSSQLSCVAGLFEINVVPFRLQVGTSSVDAVPCTNAIEPSLALLALHNRMHIRESVLGTCLCELICDRYNAFAQRVETSYSSYEAPVDLP